MRDNFFGNFQDLQPFRDKIHIVYCGSNFEFGCVVRTTEDIVQEIREAISQGKTKIVFHNPGETLLTFILLKSQTVMDVMEDVPESYFFMHCAGIDAEEEYRKFADSMKFKRRMTMLVSHNFEWSIHNFYDGIRHIPLNYEVKIKDKKFVCFNKVERIHRLDLLCRMLESGLIDKGFYSFAGTRPDWYKYYPENVKMHFGEHASEILLKHQHKFPLVCNITDERENPINLIEEDIGYHSNSYFSIVTETIFYKNTEEGYKRTLFNYLNGRFLSEKTYRPISLKHPFILLVYPNSLDVLRESGYKTFHPYIDETYDTIIDSEERMEAVWKEIVRLCSFTDEQWLEWQNNIKPIVEHNFNNFINKKVFSTKPYAHLFQN